MAAVAQAPISRVTARVAGAARGFSTRALDGLPDRQPVLVSFARTPIGRFAGGLSALRASRLGAVAVKSAVERAGLNIEADGAAIDEVFLGNVVAAGMGQAPATQASIFAGLPNTIPTTTVNKVCASGMKTVMLAADAIALGRAEIVVAGGFESMSNIPHYMPSLRGGVRLGETKVVDGLVHDGLWDAYGDKHMGSCAEICAKEHNIDRAAQDAFACESYERALSQAALSLAKDEIAIVEAPAGRGKTTTVDTDEEPAAANLEKMGSLRPAFAKDGTITAANASKLNDGAAAMVLMSAAEARRRGAKPLAAIRSFADAAHEPEWFTTAPSLAVPKALARAGLEAKDMQLHEVNEAFSVVALANMKLLNLDPATVNVHGGAVALGHPIGASGARIVGHLAILLRLRGATFGTASICNGGGGASAIVLEALQ
jgi:acetyl-CoA C-acetyltransferase